MVDFATVNSLVGRLGGTLKFFPSDPDARIGIAQEIGDMAGSEEQVRWIVGMLPKIYSEWPGMLEVRGVFCTRYKPRDGVEAALGTGSPAFASLCTADEDERSRIAAPLTLRLAGEVAPVTVDNEMQELIERVCAARKPAPLDGVKAATQADIDAIKAIQERNRREREGVTQQQENQEVAAGE